MPSHYSRLRGCVHLYFDAMTTVLMIALSRLRHASGDNLPRIPVGYRIHADEVLKRYSPDYDRAIHRIISCQIVCQMKL